MGKRGPKPGQGKGPKKNLNWEQIGNMCAIHCTQAEIAAVVGCHIDTLNNRCKEEYGVTFSEFLREKRKAGRSSLRRRMWKLVENGNVATTIFYAKNWLGMSDDGPRWTDDGEEQEFKIELNIENDAGYGEDDE